MLYPKINESRLLHITPEGGELYIGNVPQLLNRTAADILKLCNGKHSVEDICKIMAKRYNDKNERVKRLIQKFLEESEKRGNIILTASKDEKPPLISGNQDLWVPFSVTAEVTVGCDLRCIHCYAEAGPPKLNELSTSKWLEILDELHNLGTRSLAITGGDPFTRSDIFEILDFCNKKFAIRLLTSGYRINKVVVEILLSLKNIQTVQISLDGPDAKTHDYVRGKKGAFEKAVAAIKMLAEEDMNVEVAMVMLPVNKDKMEETILLAKKLGAKFFLWGRVFPCGRAAKKHLLSSGEMRALFNEAISLTHKYSDKDFSVNGLGKTELLLMTSSALSLDKDEIEAGDILKVLGMKNCGAGYKTLFLTSTGDIKPCGILNYVMGTVMDRSIKEILQSSAAEFFRDLPTPSREMCNGCEKRDACSACHGAASIYGQEKVDCAWIRQFQKVKNIQY